MEKNSSEGIWSKEKLQKTLILVFEVIQKILFSNNRSIIKYHKPDLFVSNCFNGEVELSSSSHSSSDSSGPESLGSWDDANALSKWSENSPTKSLNILANKGMLVHWFGLFFFCKRVRPDSLIISSPFTLIS